ncbi:uncharacterized protein [Triticum aestivum]|uniref:uncharacterized protein n=1 Tax=Triticum aestivum TaxID=4565 RepID=UPI001D02509F|nr:uncharacterized protein LOC123147159 [Triticum aestivum]
MDVLARSAPSAYSYPCGCSYAFLKCFLCFFLFAGFGNQGILGRRISSATSIPFFSIGMVCPVCCCPGAPCFLFVPADEVPEVFDVVLDEYCSRRMICCCWFGGLKEKVAASKNRLDKLFRNIRRQGEI